jgi:hypothetical protein
VSRKIFMAGAPCGEGPRFYVGTSGDDVARPRDHVTDARARAVGN